MCAASAEVRPAHPPRGPRQLTTCSRRRAVTAAVASLQMHRVDPVRARDMPPRLARPQQQAALRPVRRRLCVRGQHPPPPPPTHPPAPRARASSPGVFRTADKRGSPQAVYDASMPRSLPAGTLLRLVARWVLDEAVLLFRYALVVVVWGLVLPLVVRWASGPALPPPPPQHLIHGAGVAAVL